MTPTGVLGVTVPLMILSSGNASSLLFLLTLVIFFFLAMAIGMFAQRCVSAGSLGTFVHLGLGPRWGVAASWAYLVGLAYSANIAAVGAADYLDIAVTRLTGLPSGTALVFLFTTLVFLGAWWTAYRDIKLSTELMLYIEAISLSIMVFLLGFIVIRTGAWVDRAQFSVTGLEPATFQPGFVFAFTCLAGFESVLTLGEEAKSPLKTVPRVMLSGVLLLGVFFFLVAYGLVAVWHRGGLTLDDFNDPFVVIAERIHAPWLGLVSSFGVATSFFACALASITAAARVLFALARDGRFWPGAARVHPRNATPARAIALVALFGLASTLGFLAGGIGVGPTIDYLSCIGTTGFVAAYLLVSIAAPVYLRRQGALSWPGAVAAGLAAISMVVVLVFTVYPEQPAPNRYYILVFFGIVATGSAMSLLKPWRRKVVVRTNSARAAV
jgi:amino acid transporter